MGLVTRITESFDDPENIMPYLTPLGVAGKLTANYIGRLLAEGEAPTLNQMNGLTAFEATANAEGWLSYVLEFYPFIGTTEDGVCQKLIGLNSLVATVGGNFAEGTNITANGVYFQGQSGAVIVGENLPRIVPGITMQDLIDAEGLGLAVYVGEEAALPTTERIIIGGAADLTNGQAAIGTGFSGANHLEKIRFLQGTATTGTTGAWSGYQFVAHNITTLASTNRRRRINGVATVSPAYESTIPGSGLTEPIIIGGKKNGPSPSAGFEYVNPWHGDIRCLALLRGDIPSAYDSGLRSAIEALMTAFERDI